MADIFNMTDTWNDAGVTFSAIKMDVTDTASAAGSNLLDLQVGGVSRFWVDKRGSFRFGGGGSNLEYIKGTGLTIGRGTSTRPSFYFSDSVDYQFRMAYISTVNWTSGGAEDASDLTLARDAANTFAQRNGTNAQTFNIYNTYTDASNYERFSIKWDSNVLKLGNEAAGTGSLYRTVEFYRAGSKMITLTTSKVNIDGGSLELTNSYSPHLIIPEDSSGPAGATDKAVIFAEDDGAGKTRLMAQFQTGAPQQLAIEP